MKTQSNMPLTDALNIRAQMPGQSSGQCAKDATFGDPAPLIRKILVPTDFSERSNAALKYAVSLANRYDAKIVLLHVAQLPASCAINAPPDVEKMMSLARRSVEGTARLIPPEIAREQLVRFGTEDTVHTIVREARKAGADLIVIATHGYSGLKRVLLGSTAEGVLRHAPCPVLAVRSLGCYENDCG